MFKPINFLFDQCVFSIIHKLYNYDPNYSLALVQILLSKKITKCIKCKNIYIYIYNYNERKGKIFNIYNILF